MVGTSGQAARRCGAITASGERAAGHVRQHHVAVDHQQLDHAAQAVGQRLAVAAIRHVQHLGAGLRGQRRHADVGHGALTRRAVAHAVRTRLGEFDQAGEVLHRQRLGGDDGDRSDGHAGQRRQVLQRVVVGLGQMRVDRQRAGRGQQGGAVRLRPGHHVGAHRGASARLVLDDDSDVRFLAQHVAQAAPDRVGAAAGGVTTSVTGLAGQSWAIAPLAMIARAAPRP